MKRFLIPLMFLARSAFATPGDPDSSFFPNTVTVVGSNGPLSTEAKQDAQETTLQAILAAIGVGPSGGATAANQVTQINLATSANTKLDTLHSDNLDIETLLTGVQSRQDTGNTTLASILSGMATASNQSTQITLATTLNSKVDTVNSNLITIQGKQDVQTTVLNAISLSAASIDADIDVALSTRASEATLSSFKSANHTDLTLIDTDLLAFKTANHSDLLTVQAKQDAQTLVLNAISTSDASIDSKFNVNLSTRASEVTAAGIRTDLTTTIHNDLTQIHNDVTAGTNTVTSNASSNATLVINSITVGTNTVSGAVSAGATSIVNAVTSAGATSHSDLTLVNNSITQGTATISNAVTSGTASVVNAVTSGTSTLNNSITGTVHSDLAGIRNDLTVTIHNDLTQVNNSVTAGTNTITASTSSQTNTLTAAASTNTNTVTSAISAQTNTLTTAGATNTNAITSAQGATTNAVTAANSAIVNAVTAGTNTVTSAISVQTNTVTAASASNTNLITAAQAATTNAVTAGTNAVTAATSTQTNTLTAAAATNANNITSAINTTNTNLGAQADAAASTDTGTFSLISLFKRSLQSLTTIITRLGDGLQKTMIVDVVGNIISSIGGMLSVTALDTNGTGSITASGQSVTITGARYSTAHATLSGTFTGTVTFECSDENSPSVFTGIQATVNQGGFIASVSAPTDVFIGLGGWKVCRIRSTAWTSGTGNISWTSTIGPNHVEVTSANQAAFSGNMRMKDGAGNATTSDFGASSAALRIAALVGNATGVADFGAGSVGAQTVRVAAVPEDGGEISYRATATFAAAATPTDIFTITGSGTKTVRITRVGISATETTSGEVNLTLLKRSTANTAGTSATPTIVPMDSADAAATAVVRNYTANPTLGTLIGNIQNLKFTIPVVAVGGNDSSQTELIESFGANSGKPVVLRGTSEVFAVNLNSVTITGNSFSIWIEWGER